LVAISNLHSQRLIYLIIKMLYLVTIVKTIYNYWHIHLEINRYTFNKLIILHNNEF